MCLVLAIWEITPVTFSCKILDTNCESEVQNEPLLMIPKGFLDTTKDEKSPLSNFMNSEELCGVFSIPTENIVGFEIQEIKRFAINYQSTTMKKVLAIFVIMIALLIIIFWYC